MPDKGEEKNLVVAAQRGLTQKEPQLPPRESMNLEAARSILTTVVNTHENTFTEGTDLNRVGDMSAEQLREALLLVAQDVMQRNDGRNDAFGITRIEKKTSLGKLALVIYHQVGSSENLPKDSKPDNLYLLLTDSGRYILESEVPLRQSDSWIRQDAVRFSDFRKGRNVISGYDLKKNFTLDKFRYIWRGMRWLCANILDWDENLKLPEDLDRPLLSSNGKIAISAPK